MPKLDFPLFYILRGVQAIFALIVLGITGHVVNRVYGQSDTVNFMLFNGVWSLFIVVPYSILTPIFVPALAHRFALVAVDAVTMIFWFAGFIALAADIGDPQRCSKVPLCREMQAATAFGAFNWVLFLATTVLNALGALRRDPAPGSQPPTAHVP